MSLPLQDYQRYGRQMILEGFGLPGQLSLHKGAVVVVGAGGLGCPAIQYLAASGVGRLGIIDHDRVALSNLQRQVLFTDEDIDAYKADSAARSVKRINASTKVDVFTEMLTAENALSLLRPYDVILDCTDNSPTRYLLSDAAVALKTPLVSGAAQKYEGQLSVYNLQPTGPCYRCIFPRPPPMEVVGSCEETGILGPVTGVIGNMQALEAIKLLTGLHSKEPTMLIFSALGNPPFRSIKLRNRKPNCLACGDSGQPLLAIHGTDYVQFCGGPIIDWEKEGLAEYTEDKRVTASDLNKLLKSNEPVRLIDVRPATEFGICHLPGSENIKLRDIVAEPQKYIDSGSFAGSTVIVCRLGNDSKIAAKALRKASKDTTVKDLVGGLRSWSKEVDQGFPCY